MAVRRGSVGRAMSSGVRLTGCSKRVVPTLSDGTGAPCDESQDSLRVMTAAVGPARSDPSCRLATPAWMLRALVLQPVGREAMQGRNSAEGTAWAMRIIVWLVPQPGSCTPMFSAGNNDWAPE